MGKRIPEKEGALSNGNSSHHTHPGRVWGILHIIKYHHWRHVKRRLTHRRHGCGKFDARAEMPGTSTDSGFAPMPALSNVEENLVKSSTPPAKHSIRSRIKSILHEDTHRKKGKHKRSSTCPTKSQLTHVDSTHHMEVDPLSELLLTVESPKLVLETFQNHLAAGTLNVLSPVFSERPIANVKCVDCGTMFSTDTLEESKIHKHLSCPIHRMPEDKLIKARILTTDASPHLFKDFLDALDVINANKDYLLKYIQDPGSPLPFDVQNQQPCSSQSRRTKSISFPISDSSSGIKDSESDQLINQMVDDLFDAKDDKLQIQSNMHNVSILESAEDLHHQSISTSSSHNVDQCGKKDYNSSSVPSPVANHVKTRHFRDLRKKMKDIIEEAKNEKHRITMDAIVDKIPHGNKFTKNMKKLIHEQSEDPTNKEGKDNATNAFARRPSNSFSKRQPSTMRTSSLKDSAGRYSQLYKTCFNSEAKYPKTENLKMITEDTTSVSENPKSLKRFLSMPNLKSYFHQNEEPSIHLTPQNSFSKYGDKTTSISFIDQQRRFDHSDESKSRSISPTHTDHGISHESSLNADQKQHLVRSASKSGIDFSYEAKVDKNIGIDGLGNLRDNEQDTGDETESTTIPVEVSSTFSSDTSFLDVAFDLENLNILEELDSESKSGPIDGQDNMDQQQEAKVDEFNNEIPCIKVDASNKAAFNYVRKVLEHSGFIGRESHGVWYSDDQPVDPSVYEELEGCLLLDPDCSGNDADDGLCNHLLLFDIINEGLLEIFGRSYSYYPRSLSSLSRVHPLPSGDSVLHKVWALISCYMNTITFELFPSLDYYVSKDLAKYDGWMNLQFDSECVALELDDWIFDDLLEEIIYT